MSNELVAHDGQSLQINEGQESFTQSQRAALEHIGIQGASQGDVDVFFRYCQATGLDPFRNQIYMIRRQNKWTIQTGINGYRKITSKVAAAQGKAMSITGQQWCGEDGQWVNVWLSKEPPAAARCTVGVGEGSFTAVAVYSEYVQVTKDGRPNSMWARMPANQLVKCAEAAAHRMACPDDLSGLYIEEELPTRVDSVREKTGDRPRVGGQSVRERAAAQARQERSLTDELRKDLDDMNIARGDARKQWIESVVGRHLESMEDLSKSEISTVYQALAASKKQPEVVDAEPVQDGGQ